MKRVNILVDVEDDIYEKVVVPFKNNKLFTKLITALLSGYIEDNYIHSYTEDSIYNLRRTSVSSLDNILEDMNKSLASMGLYTDEAMSAVTLGGSTVEEFTHSSSNPDKGYTEYRDNQLSLKDSSESVTTGESSEYYKELILSIEKLQQQDRDILQQLSQIQERVETNTKKLSEGMNFKQVEVDRDSLDTVENVPSSSKGSIIEEGLEEKLEELTLVESTVEDDTDFISSDMGTLEPKLSLISEDDDTESLGSDVKLVEVENTNSSGLSAKAVMSSLLSGNLYSF